MSELSYDQHTYLARFIHPDKAYPALNDLAIAAIFEMPLETYRQIKAECTAAVRRTAEELLTENDFADRVDRLPFAPGSTVVGLGDSITDDWQSWLEILRGLLSIRRPNDAIRVINAGVTGNTTPDMISRFTSIALEKPDWIICMAGTNDARKHGIKPLKVLVSPEETEKNLAMLRNFGATQTSAQWVWMTPTPVILERITEHWLLGGGQAIWTNDDLTPIVDAVRRQKDPVVDLQKVFGIPPNSEYLLDGLHPSLLGQKNIIRALVEQLT